MERPRFDGEIIFKNSKGNEVLGLQLLNTNQWVRYVKDPTAISGAECEEHMVYTNATILFSVNYNVRKMHNVCCVTHFHNIDGYRINSLYGDIKLGTYSFTTLGTSSVYFVHQSTGNIKVESAVSTPPKTGGVCRHCGTLGEYPIQWLDGMGTCCRCCDRNG
jgi:hypothetical protein